MLLRANKRSGLWITAVQALLFLGVCLLVGAHAPLHDLDLSGADHGSHEPATPFHEHPMLLVVSGTLIVLTAFLVRIRSEARSPLARGPRAAPVATRWDNDVGLHLLHSTLRI